MAVNLERHMGFLTSLEEAVTGKSTSRPDVSSERDTKLALAIQLRKDLQRIPQLEHGGDFIEVGGAEPIDIGQRHYDILAAADQDLSVAIPPTVKWQEGQVEHALVFDQNLLPDHFVTDPKGKDNARDLVIRSIIEVSGLEKVYDHRRAHRARLDLDVLTRVASDIHSYASSLAPGTST